MTVYEEPTIQLFKQRLPWHGFGAESKGYVAFLPGSELLKRALVQYQQRHSIGWLVYDLDSPTAILDVEDRQAPPPNILAMNRTNGHAHLFYALEKPVHDYANASQKALRYTAAVDLALTDKLGADPGYAKLLAKNPLREDRWYVIFPRNDLYDLDELADWLDLSKYRDRRKRLPTHGLGRNVTLFETLRVWAYRARRQPFLSEGLFAETVLQHALVLNSEFTPPLPHSEVRATAKSVSRWTWRRMSREGFLASQRRLSARGNAAKRRMAQERHEEIRRATRQCPDLTQADIAAICGCSRRTVNHVLVSARREGRTNPISDREASRGVGNPISDRAGNVANPISDRGMTDGTGRGVQNPISDKRASDGTDAT